ncbi:hypothetical protein LTR27_011649 [Elasticomyces elasticus]|nr:hypothetical protein LTR27_011649 [Elasticomyces elasticus]
MLNSTTPTNPSSPPHKREAPAHESPLSKRLRQDDALPDHQQTLEAALEAAVAALDHETVRGLLLDAARVSSAIPQATLAKYDEKKQFEQARTVDFRSYINELATISDSERDSVSLSMELAVYRPRDGVFDDLLDASRL